MDIDKEDLKQIWSLIVQSHLVLNKEFVIEIYHHLGLEHFRETGAVFINIINKEYCKSYVVLLAGQSYPKHYHKIKMETFFVIYGDLIVSRDDGKYLLKPGELLSIERGESHSFSSDTGVVFEEMSTTYIKNDSIYEDCDIGKRSYEQRRTLIPLCKFREMIEDDRGK